MLLLSEKISKEVPALLGITFYAEDQVTFVFGISLHVRHEGFHPFLKHRPVSQGHGLQLGKKIQHVCLRFHFLHGTLGTRKQTAKWKEKFNQMMWDALWNLKHTLLAQLILSQLWALFPLVTPTHQLTISPTQQLLAQQKSSHTAAAERKHLQLLLYQALVSLGGL